MSRLHKLIKLKLISTILKVVTIKIYCQDVLLILGVLNKNCKYMQKIFHSEISDKLHIAYSVLQGSFNYLSMLYWNIFTYFKYHSEINSHLIEMAFIWKVLTHTTFVIFCKIWGLQVKNDWSWKKHSVGATVLFFLSWWKAE